MKRLHTLFPNYSTVPRPRFLRGVLLLFLLLSATADLAAQRNNDKWYFGDRAALDFSGGAPVALENSSMTQTEASASVADVRSGALLFYTDGIRVWNRNHAEMSGVNLIDPLFGAQSATQSALIVPKPKDSTKFYIFTTDDWEDDDRGLNYSIVDMTLDGGLGAVTSKNIPLLANSTEKLTATGHSNKCELWVLGHGVGNNLFHAWRVTGGGVTEPAEVSAAGSVHPTSVGKVGYMKVSPDGRWLVTVVAGEYAGETVVRNSRVELFNFDNTTGAVTFVTQLPQQETDYGAAFSPDSRKLYISYDGPVRGGIYQFDLSTSDPAAITASRTSISTQNDVQAMQLGPDGRIYVARTAASFLGVIANPDAGGAGANFIANGVSLKSRLSTNGLPNMIDGFDATFDACLSPVPEFEISDTTICAGGCITVTDRSINSPTGWQWTFAGGNPSSSNRRDPGLICFDTPGEHRISLTVTNDNGGAFVSDTVVVSPAPVVDATNDTTICLGRGVPLTAQGGISGPGGYKWTPSATLTCDDCRSPIATPTVTTKYYVTVMNADSCTALDSVTVTVTEAAKPVISPNDTVVLCAGGSATLTTQGTHAAYLWSNGANTPSVTVTTAGSYAVTVTDAEGCRATSDSVVVIVNDRLDPVVAPEGPTTFCAGDSVVLTAPAGYATYSWNTLETTQSIVVRSSGTYTVTVGTGTCSEESAPVSVAVKPAPTPFLASGSPSLCAGDSVMLDAGEGYVTYDWSHGADTRVVWVKVSGTYSVTVTNAEGCSGRSEPVTVVIGEPSVAAVTLPTVDAAPGEKITIDLVVPTSTNLENSCSREFTAEIRFNKTLLKPVGATPAGVVDGNDRVLTITGNRDAVTQSGTLASLEFVVALGNALSTPLTIASFQWDRGGVQTTTTDGELRLKDLCTDGSTRLIDGNGAFGLKSARPNPTGDIVEIEYGVVESGRTRLVLTDGLGRLAATLVDTDLAPGLYIGSFDLSALPPGLYRCTMTTPTAVVHQSIVVVR